MILLESMHLRRNLMSSRRNRTILRTKWTGAMMRSQIISDRFCSRPIKGHGSQLVKRPRANTKRRAEYSGQALSFCCFGASLSFLPSCLASSALRCVFSCACRGLCLFCFGRSLSVGHLLSLWLFALVICLIACLMYGLLCSVRGSGPSRCLYPWTLDLIVWPSIPFAFLFAGFLGFCGFHGTFV